MSNSKEAAKTEEEVLEFKWGKKRGVGGKKKEVLFYDSFTFDGDDYQLYDCVYLYKDGEPEPYIGKLVKIWEQPESKRKVKVLWFFRPSEIQNYIGDGNSALENEIFLASGEGAGLANINPLEVIAGKCNVVCTSNDPRNPQPSAEELRKADFIFSRTFDVSNHIISDKIDEKIAGIEARFIFNRNGDKKCSDVPKKAIAASKEDGKLPVSNASQLSSKLSSPEATEDTMANDKHAHSVAKEDKDVKAPVVKQDPLPGQAGVSCGGTKPKETASTPVKKENALDSNAIPKLKAELDEDKCKTGKATISQGGNKEKSSKKERIDNSAKSFKEKPSVPAPLALNKDKSNNVVQKKLKVDCDDDAVQTSPLIGSASENSKKSKTVRGSNLQEQGAPKKLKPNEKSTKVSNGKPPKAAIQQSSEKDIVPEGKTIEVTRRPSDTDRSKWFKGLRDWSARIRGFKSLLPQPLSLVAREKGCRTFVGPLPISLSFLPWEERMKKAHDQGTLLLFENLDPAFTSAEIEDLVWHSFREICTAKVVQRTAVSSPHSGQAFVIFKSRDAAEDALSKLEDGCLMLPNGRPLVASIGSPPNLSGKPSTFLGHLFIDKLKHQQREEIKRAVSTSHCSQPNTLEYDMAMEWCLLQARSDSCWKELYKQHGDELRKLKATLKLK